MSEDVNQLVGRDREREQLLALLDRARRGEGAVVAITGEAGIGKTAMVADLARSATARGMVVVEGRCLESGFSTPFSPWESVASQCALRLGPDRLVRLMGIHAPALVRLAPEFEPSLVDPAAGRSLPGHDERLRLRSALAALVRRIPVPTLLFLEDIHWADEPALELLQHAASEVSGSCVLIALTYRVAANGTPLLAAEGALRRGIAFTTLELRRLNSAGIADLGRKLTARILTEAAVDWLAAETGGNPLYVRELVLHLLEEGSLPGDNPAVQVPSGIRSIIARRAQRLSAEAGLLLRTAAAFLGPFPLEWLAAGTGMTDAALLDALDEILAAGFLHLAPETPGVVAPRYSFSHSLVRRAVLESINPDRRIRLHRSLAEALLAIRADAAAVASQYHLSRSLPGASAGLPFVLSAVASAREARAYEKAVALAALAIEIAAEAPVSLRAEATAALALANAEALQLKEASDNALAAAELLCAADRPGAAAELLEKVARTLFRAGADEALWRRLVDRGLGVAGIEPAVRIRLKLMEVDCRAISTGPLYISRWIGMDPEVVEAGRRSNDEEIFAATLSPFDWRTRKETEGLITRSRTLRDPSAILAGLDVAARDLLHRQADYSGARALLEEMLWTAERFGSVAGQAEAHYGLAKCHAVLGDLSSARAAAARVPDLVARLGPVHRLATMSRTALNFEIGYLGGVDWLPIAEASEAFVRNPAAGRTPLGLINAAFAALAWASCAERSRAQAILSLLPPVLERMDPRDYMYAGSIDLCAAALWEIRSTSAARRWLELARTVPPEAGTAPIGCTELTRARLASLAGDHQAARADFSEARNVLAARGFVGAAAIADHDEAIHLWPGHRDRALDLARQAATGFAALGMTPWVLKARRMLSLDEAGNLTNRELEVIRLLASGASNKEIARHLALSVATVTRHVANIYPKIGARGRADATRYAMEHGLTRPPA